MTVSGISAATSNPTGGQQVQPLGQHKHGGHHSPSISDVDAQGSSLASAPSSTGKVGSTVDVTA